MFGLALSLKLTRDYERGSSCVCRVYEGVKRWRCGEEGLGVWGGVLGLLLLL